VGNNCLWEIIQVWTEKATEMTTTTIKTPIILGQEGLWDGKVQIHAHVANTHGRFALLEV
jgi:hypothetical protein